MGWLEPSSAEVSKSIRAICQFHQKITIIKSQGLSSEKRPKLLPAPHFKRAGSEEAAKVTDFLAS